MSINIDNAKELFFQANGRTGTMDELDDLINSLNSFSGIGRNTNLTKSSNKMTTQEDASNKMTTQEDASVNTQGGFSVGMNTQSEFLGPPREVHLKKQNKCYIISNRFENSKQSPLLQYKIDEENITKTFSWLNFKVKKKIDQTTEKIKNFINSISKDDHTESQCIVLFILSHGNDEGEIMGTNDNLLKIDWIIKKFQDTESLIGKPKLIFVQACRGTQEEKAVEEMQTAGNKAILRAQKSDTFVYYCSMPGTLSYVSSVTGSFFLNKLCAVLREYCHNSKYHFGDVVTKVNDVLSTFVRIQKTGEKVKELVQVSEACSSLTSHIYFYPNGEYNEG